MLYVEGHTQKLGHTSSRIHALVLNFPVSVPKSSHLSGFFFVL